MKKSELLKLLEHVPDHADVMVMDSGDSCAHLSAEKSIVARDHTLYLHLHDDADSVTVG